MLPGGHGRKPQGPFNLEDVLEAYPLKCESAPTAETLAGSCFAPESFDILVILNVLEVEDGIIVNQFVDGVLFSFRKIRGFDDEAAFLQFLQFQGYGPVVFYGSPVYEFLAGKAFAPLAEGIDDFFMLLHTGGLFQNGPDINFLFPGFLEHSQKVVRLRNVDLLHQYGDIASRQHRRIK